MGACFSGCIPALVLIVQRLTAFLLRSRFGKGADPVKVPAFDAHFFALGFNSESVLLLGFPVTVLHDFALDDFNAGKAGAFSGSGEDRPGEYNFIASAAVASPVKDIPALSCILLENLGAFLVSIPAANCGHFVFGFFFRFHCFL